MSGGLGHGSDTRGNDARGNRSPTDGGDGESGWPPGRRARIRAERLNGIDAVEADDDGLTLTVTFLGKAPHGLGPENVRIDGGRRITRIRAVATSVEREEDPELDDRLVVTVDRAGDTSRYRLSLVEADPYGRPGTAPYPGFEQRYYGADFTFRPDRPAPFDCGDGACAGDCGSTCAGGDGDGYGDRDGQGGADGFPTAPVIDYTARDYDSIRRLLLDRLVLTTPGWVERNPADLGMTLVELLAYTGDRISYQQDAVATEAYLDTARRRVSVRRHVRLIDYAMHDGCNARAFVTVETAREHMLLPGTFRFAAVDVHARDPHVRPEPGTVIDDRDLAVLDEHGSVEVFEPVTAEPLVLREAHNTIRLWTWGGEVRALPRGATAATLVDGWADEDGERDSNGHGLDHRGDGHGHGGDGRDRGGHEHGGDGHDHHDHGGDGHDHQGRRRALSLRAGDVLILEEVKGPRSGTSGDADPAHRQPVRLTSVTPAYDAVEDQPVLEVTWAREDALRFPLCLATLGGPDCAPVEDVSVARGNVVLVDHGRSVGGPPGAGVPGTFGRGELPQTVTVPPDPAVVAPCCPPGFGCGDREEGNAPGRLVGALTRKTASGRLLTPDDVRELFTVVGEAAVLRAGIGLELAGLRRVGPPSGDGDGRVVPGTAPEQAAALRTLLAQSVYPGIAPRFRSRLDCSDVAQAVPFPLPERVAAGQAERLAAIPGRLRGRLVELWRSARDRDGLTEDEVAELAVVFGLDVIERFELRRHPVRALRDLLHRSDELLAGKRRRLAVLTARARAGTVLDGHLAWEIEQTWGPGYTAGLHPDEPELRGPASTALAQDPRAALPAVRLHELDGGTGTGSDRPDGNGQAGGDGHAAGDDAHRTDDSHVTADSHVTGEGHVTDRRGPGGPRGAVWSPRRDLLESGPRDRHFVGELEDDGHLALRFGDGRYGARPTPGARLAVHYRLGGGRSGNVGAEAINHLVLVRDEDAARAHEAPVAGVRNPLPAVGGTDPEPVDQVRQLAPLDLRRTRLRAVTAEDYAVLASAVPGVQRAAAELRWTGSGQEAHVAVDSEGDAAPSPQLLQAVGQALEAYRLIGHDLVVGPARLVPLDIALTVCAAPGHQHGQILAELYRVLGSRRLGNGRHGGRVPGGNGPGRGGLGFFHPDALTFGEPVRLSRLVAVAAAVPGVVSVEVTRLRRLFRADSGGGHTGSVDDSAIRDGVLRLGPLEIATCDNDPERPEAGRLEITLGGVR